MLNSCLVVLNYNDLERCLSVLKYGMDNSLFEHYVLVDNASQDFDEGPFNKDEFSDLIVLKNNKNLGYGVGHNVGLRYALLDSVKYIV